MDLISRVGFHSHLYAFVDNRLVVVEENKACLLAVATGDPYICGAEEAWQGCDTLLGTATWYVAQLSLTS